MTFSGEARPNNRTLPNQMPSQGADMQMLVVEDQEDTLQVLTGLLRRWGCDVLPADSLKSGMDRLGTQPPIDVILSDIGLPDGTGYALVSEARRRGKRVLAIALSGYPYPSDVRIAELARFDPDLSKPRDGHYLRTILQDRPSLTT